MDLTYKHVDEYFSKLKYRKLTQKQEMHFIRKAQLSFYDDVDDAKKEEFVTNYFKEFPFLKKEYISANLEGKKIILQNAIEESYRYRDMFLENNLRLVVSFIKNFKSDTLTYMDFIQEGNIGLIIALQRFNTENNNKFSTYAEQWIKSRVFRMLYKNTTLKISEHLQIDILKLNKAKEYFDQQGIIPSEKQLAQKARLSLAKLKVAEKESKRLQEPLSLDDFAFKNGDNTTIEEIIEDGSQDFVPSLLDYIDGANLYQMIENMGLEERNIEIMRKLYGFDGKVYNKTELGKKKNLSRSTIAKIEKNVLTKCKNELQRGKVR